MNRNSLRSLFFSTLNPDSIYQIPFQSQNHNQVEQNVQKNQKKSEKKCPQKQKYLTIVSKPKKPLNRSVLKSQKKILNKRSQSVILGGQKTTASRMRTEDKSIKSSLCNSCICLHQNTQITPHSQPLPQKSLIQKDNLQNSIKTPTNYASLHHINNQVSKIVSHKLNMDLVQPHQSIVKQIIFKTPVKQEGKGFERRFTRNFSTTGKIYFSYGKPSSAKQTNQDKKFFSTPKFQRTNQITERKSRRNAGFIRSASVKKISPERLNVDKDEVQRKRSMSNFSLSQYCSEGAQNTETKPKRLEVDLCLQKMSAIRKEIDQLQGMLHDRLETAELRNKLMYYPQQIIERKVNVLRFEQNQNKRKYYLQAEGPSHQSVSKASQMSSNNSYLCQSKTQTLVNNLTRLDNTKPNSIVGGLSQSSLSSFSSGSIQMSNQNNARKQPLGVHKIDNILSNKFQNTQCPSAQQIQKRVISQILFNKKDNPSHQNYNPSQNVSNHKRAFKHQNGNPCAQSNFGGITGNITAEKGFVNQRPNFMMTNFIR